MYAIDEMQADLYLLLGEARSKPHHVHHVALDDPNVGKVASPKSIEILSFALLLFPLERKLLVTGEWRMSRHIEAMRGDQLTPLCSQA